MLMGLNKLRRLNIYKLFSKSITLALPAFLTANLFASVKAGLSRVAEVFSAPKLAFAPVA